MKIAVILDNNCLTKWQLDSIKKIENMVNIELILNCQNTKIKKNIKKNFFYYVLNFLCIRNAMTKKKNISHYFKKNIIYNFDSKYKKNWQVLPIKIIDLLISKDIDCVVKFGMNLLLVDNTKFLKYGVISFHHGDPTKYRGRPSGFYEILNKESNIGIVVQKINNTLDSGDIIALGYSKIFKYSYKKTLIELFNNSTDLLVFAIQNLKNNTVYELKKSKKLYFLPNNFLVIKFFYYIFYNFVKRIIYGIFYEKKWNINIQSFDINKINLSKDTLLEVKNYKKINNNFQFYADPFFLNDGSIVAEALNKNGKGQLIVLNQNSLKIKKKLFEEVLDHFSYPCTFKIDNNSFILPEVASWSKQFIYSINDNKKTYLKGFEKYKIIDPTYFYFNKTHYIFCNFKGNADTKLYLFYSKNSIFDKFVPHPLNPININPINSRMGGQILLLNNKIYRFGQNNSESYGNGLVVSEIKKISPNKYEEKIVSQITVNKFKGPHTINIFKNRLIFDFYYDKFNILAGFKRIKSLY